MPRTTCDLWWGSHGCDLPAGHTEEAHQCGSTDEDGPCSEFIETPEPAGRIRWAEGDEEELTWSEWMDGPGCFR